MSDLSAALVSTDVEPWLVEAVGRLARSEDRSLDSFLVTVGEDFLLDGTRATCRCHFLVRDGNGRPSVNGLAKKLASQAVDYCIPRSRIEEAHAYLLATGSTEKFTQLAEEARNLFTRLTKSGEGGELLLYLLLEVVLELPQLLCKMSLKTNDQMHVHGVDGVHARALSNGNLAIYWGEAKMHATVESAIDECIESIAPYLLDEGGGEAERDLLLVRDNLNTGDTDLTAALLQYLNPDNPESNLVEFRGACLVGFSLDEYPEPFGEDGVSVAEEVAESVQAWYERLRKKIDRHKLVAFEIEVFCVPVPSVDDFRAAVKKSLGLG